MKKLGKCTFCERQATLTFDNSDMKLCDGCQQAYQAGFKAGQVYHQQYKYRDVQRSKLKKPVNLPKIVEDTTKEVKLGIIKEEPMDVPQTEEVPKEEPKICDNCVLYNNGFCDRDSEKRTPIDTCDRWIKRF